MGIDVGLKTFYTEFTPETLEHDFDVMERETIRLQRLIEDLFALSQAKVDSLTLNCQPNDIANDPPRGERDGCFTRLETQLTYTFNSGSATSITIFVHGWYGQGSVYV